jgi:hypothetical protein
VGLMRPRVWWIHGRASGLLAAILNSFRAGVHPYLSRFFAALKTVDEVSVSGAAGVNRRRTAPAGVGGYVIHGLGAAVAVTRHPWHHTSGAPDGRRSRPGFRSAHECHR